MGQSANSPISRGNQPIGKISLKARRESGTIWAIFNFCVASLHHRSRAARNYRGQIWQSGPA
jgi:hypothetical protein